MKTLFSAAAILGQMPFDVTKTFSIKNSIKRQLFVFFFWKTSQNTHALTRHWRNAKNRERFSKGIQYKLNLVQQQQQ